MRDRVGPWGRSSLFFGGDLEKAGAGSWVPFRMVPGTGFSAPTCSWKQVTEVHKAIIYMLHNPSTLPM